MSFMTKVATCKIDRVGSQKFWGGATRIKHELTHHRKLIIFFLVYSNSYEFSLNSTNNQIELLTGIFLREIYYGKYGDYLLVIIDNIFVESTLSRIFWLGKFATQRRQLLECDFPIEFHTRQISCMFCILYPKGMCSDMYWESTE